MKRGVSGLLLIAAAAIWLAFSSVAALADRRVALVIGNSSYQNVARLPNPAKDADAIAQMFMKAGFEAVQLRMDLGYLDFRRTLRRFEDASASADIAVIFYAGHGLELNGTNYLLPIDAKLAVDRDTRDEAIELGRLIEAVESSKRLSLVILDACRDNPFLNTMKRQRQVVRGTTRGSGLVDPTGEMRKDMLIAYAAKEGSTAEDGNGEHSPFTTAILHNLTEPGLDIRLAFGRIRDEVLKATNNQQEPYVYTSMGGGSISLVPTPTQPKLPSEDEIRLDYNTVMKAFEAVHTRVPLDVFIKKYPTGFYTELVREQLKKFESEQKLASRESENRLRSPPLSADAQAWDDLKDSNDKDAILKFMRLYRNSPKYLDAQSRLKLILEREMNDAWEAATAANTSAALQDFVRRYPNSPFVTEAKRRADQAIQAAQERERQERVAKAEAEMNKAWEAAQEANAPAALEDFAGRYPQSPHASEAKRRANQLIQAAQERETQERAAKAEAEMNKAWEAAQEANAPAALEGFAGRYPQSPHASEAKRRANQLIQAAQEERAAKAEAEMNKAWEAAQAVDSPPALQDFVRRYPNSPFVTEAKRRADQLIQAAQERETQERAAKAEAEMNKAWEAAQEANAPAALKDYVNRYPDSPFITEAKRRADLLIKAAEEKAQAEAAEARRRAVEAAAARAWKAVQNSNNPVDLQSFINAFPDSSLALNEATQRLGVLDREAKERIERAQMEAAKARSAWDEIKNSADQVVLQEFIARYANTPVAQTDAKNRLEELRRRQREEAEASTAWNKIKGTDSPTQLRDFAKRYPASPLAIEAAQRAAALDREIKERAEKAAEAAAARALWSNIKNTNNPAVVRNFLNRYPDSPLALNEAKKLLDALEDAARRIEEKARTDAEAATAWGQIKDTSDRAELRIFIDRYPASPLVLNDAKKRLSMLEREVMESEKKARADADAAVGWNKIKGTDSPTQLRDFAKRYPDSPLAIEAAQRAAALDREIKERAEKAAEAAAARALWSNIKNTNNPAVVRNFLNRYPDSPLALNEAKELLDALEDAARRIEEKARTDGEAATAWGQIKDTSDRAELRNFIDRYPASPLALNDAKKRLSMLEREAMESEKKARADADAAAAWDRIKDTTDSAELRNFIKSYPNSHLASQDAKERLAAIEDKQKKCSSGEVLRGHTCVEAFPRPKTPSKVASPNRQESDKPHTKPRAPSTLRPAPPREEPAPHYEAAIPHSSTSPRLQSGVGF